MRHLFPKTSKLTHCGSILLSIFSLVLVLLTSNTAKATHAMGMDLTYEQLSQDSFIVTLAFYRDCAGVAAPGSAVLTLRSASCNYNYTINLPRIGNGQETTPVCTSLVTRCNGGTFPGSEEYIYRRLVVLPAQCTDWTISNEICCRNNAITTINNPGGQNIYVEAKINNFYTNSSPVFSNPPVPFVCSNQTYCFNNGAIDAEGDSLVYSLITPRTGTNVNNTVTFKAGFSKFNPITSNPAISLDSLTGDLCMFPTDSLEIAVLSILVQEYRDGVLISSIMRDIQLRILGCPNGNSQPGVSGMDSSNTFSAKVCANSNISFQVFSNDMDSAQNVTMAWNQAINGATFNVTGGNRPVGTFSWTPTMNDVRTQPFCFTVNVTDDNCPFTGSQVFSYCIYVVGVQAIADSIIDPLCAGSCDGRSSARVVNGIPPFTYLWNDPLAQTAARAVGLCAGPYQVIGIDSTGCTTTTSVLLNDPLAIELEMDSLPALCKGSSDGAGIITSISNGTAPFSVQWEVAAGLQTTDTAFNLGAGFYTVKVTDSNGCIGYDSVLVTEPLAIMLTMQNINNVSCNGLDDGQAHVVVSGGTGPFTYQWDSISNNQTSDTAFNLIAGLHTVTVTDVNGCSDTASLTITEPPSAISLNLTTVDVTCNGENSGSATVVASGGIPPYVYTWSANTGSQNTPTAINLGAGFYSVVVTDVNDCIAIPNIEITEPDFPITSTPIDSFIECYGFTNGIAGVEVNGGSVPYAYLWDVNAGSQTTQYASGLGAGAYSVYITDSLGCRDSVIVNVIEADTPLTVVISNVNVTCNNGTDGSAFVSVTGGQAPYVIQWDSTAGFQTGDTAFSLGAGTYQVSITDTYGCAVDTLVTVTEPPPLLTLTTSSTHIACKGDSTGTATVEVVGGTPPYTYLWSANSGNQTTDTAVNLSAGTYFVTVYDSNYCVTSPAIFVNEPSTALSGSVSGINVNCFNGGDGKAVAIGIGGTGLYTYQWDAAASSQTNDTAFNLAAGNYNVTIFDSLNCSFDTTAFVSQPSAPLQLDLASAPVLCFNGGSGEAFVTVTGGTTPYSISWAASANSQTNDTAVNLTSGYHSVFVSDTNNCGVEDSIYVGGPAEPLLINTFASDVLCFEGNDGYAVAQGNGGTAPYTYLWSGNAGSQANDTAFNLQTGTYTVTMFDTNSCDTSFSVFVGQPTRLEDSVYISSNFHGSAIECFGDTNGEATALGLGGTAPYSYQWDTAAGNQNTAIATNLSEGSYSVLITDSNGCITNGNISVGSPQQMAFNLADKKNISCYGGSDGRLEVNGIGGTSPYTYEWDTASVVLSTNNVLNNVAIGTYRVTLIDTNACEFDSVFTLIQPDSLVIDSLTHTNALCFGQSNGSASVFVSGGTAPYSYLWEISTGVFQVLPNAVNLGLGTYNIQVTDVKNCVVTDSVAIDQPSRVMVTTSRNDTICAAEVITISASASGGDSSSYNYIWLPQRPDSLPDQTLTPVKTTNYSVRALDASGCFSLPSLITIFVRNLNEDTLGVSSLGDICSGDTTAVVGFHNGPFNGYTYDWDHGKVGFGPHEVSPDSATYYTMNVRDICGNSISDSVLVNVNPNPEFYLDSIIAEGCNPLDVEFNDTVNTMANLTYIWRFGDGNISDLKNPIYTYAKPGTYNVSLKITTEHSCVATNEKNPSLVIVHPTPEASFTADPNSADMRDPTITFINQTKGGNSYYWDFNDGDTSTLFSPAHTFADTGKYNVWLISESDKGCIDSSNLSVLIRAYYVLEIPNAFTPLSSSDGGNWQKDPDGNRVFFPYTTNPEAVSKFEMIIFNRWGELIFESKSIYNGWDGFYKGKASPQEVYVFKISLTFENGQSFEKTGDVTLFR